MSCPHYIYSVYIRLSILEYFPHKYCYWHLPLKIFPSMTHYLTAQIKEKSQQILFSSTPAAHPLWPVTVCTKHLYCWTLIISPCCCCCCCEKLNLYWFLLLAATVQYNTVGNKVESGASRWIISLFFFFCPVRCVPQTFRILLMEKFPQHESISHWHPCCLSWRITIGFKKKKEKKTPRIKMSSGSKYLLCFRCCCGPFQIH